MTGHRVPTRHWARATLLLASLLYFAGAVAGPWAHVHGRSWTRSPSVASQSHDTGGTAAHDELGCYVWQSFGAAATPALAASVPLAEVRRIAAELAPSLPTRSSAAATRRARAPPLA